MSLSLCPTIVPTPMGASSFRQQYIQASSQAPRNGETVGQAWRLFVN